MKSRLLGRSLRTAGTHTPVGQHVARSVRTLKERLNFPARSLIAVTSLVPCVDTSITASPFFKSPSCKAGARSSTCSRPPPLRRPWPAAALPPGPYEPCPGAEAPPWLRAGTVPPPGPAAPPFSRAAIIFAIMSGSRRISASGVMCTVTFFLVARSFTVNAAFPVSITTPEMFLNPPETTSTAVISVPSPFFCPRT